MFWIRDYGGDGGPAFTSGHSRLKAACEELSDARVLQPAGATVTVQIRDSDKPAFEHVHTYRLTHETRVYLQG